MIIPDVPSVINLLILLTSVFGVFNTGAIIGDWSDAPAVVQQAYNDGDICGAAVDNSSEHNGKHIIWVDSSEPCPSQRVPGWTVDTNEVLAHEMGHIVVDNCMSEADKDWFQTARLLYPAWDSWTWDPGSGLAQWQSPNEAAADAFGRAVTNTNAYNTVPSWWAQQSMLTFGARCFNQEAYHKTFFAYQVFNQIYAPQNSLDYRVGAIMRGAQTEQQVVNGIYTTNYVSGLHANTFTEHLFTTVLNRNTTPGAERNAWRNYTAAHGQKAAFHLLIEVVYP